MSRPEETEETGEGDLWASSGRNDARREDGDNPGINSDRFAVCSGL